MHILVSTTTASDLAETAEQSIDYLQKIVDYMISKAHILISALIILIVGWYLTKFICKLVRLSDKTRLDASVTSFYQFTDQIRITRIARHHCDQ